MIVYKISDGLGNQLFQYAMGRVLSHLNGGAELYLDTATFNREHQDSGAQYHRHFHLNQFNVSVAGYVDDCQRRGESSALGLPRVQCQSLKHFSSPLLWDPRVLTLRGDVYVESFGQGWRHLKYIDRALRGELAFLHPPNDENGKILQRILGTTSVSVHVRRTDYLAAGYSMCPPEYYERAMSYIRSVFPDVQFFVFSDDSEWAIRRWKEFDDIEFVTVNSELLCHEDLRLMAACRGNIIANSTFSWWGAWLNNRPDKVVIAPKVWKDPEESSDRIVLPDWIVL